jgi:hypothetical protein
LIFDGLTTIRGKVAMKNLLKLTVVLAVMALATFSYATEKQEVVKWSQLPEMGPFGYAFSSESPKPSISADDFICDGGEPVVSVRWWGSYYEPVPAAHFYPNSAQWNDPTTPSDVPVDGMLQGFTITFYADIAAGTDPSVPWAHPGTVLYQKTVSIEDAKEEFYGTVAHTGGIEQNVWQYKAILAMPPETGFEQDDGVTYWLSIVALHRNQSIQWGWQEAIQPGWNADMVQQGYNQLINWDLVPNKQLAFELLTQDGDIPEPASIFAISIALLGFVMQRKAR